MAKNLVIVESPAKMKTVKKFLGANYTVEASNGHVRDFPKSQFGIDVDNDFEPKYITIRGKGELLAKLRKEAKKADKIYLATDPDREGEAISWHLMQALKTDTAKMHRITFNEVTKTAVKASIKQARELDMNLVDAQQARRMLDRMVGYTISPLLWAKVKRGLSAGRVQSVTLRIIADREEEIAAFIPEEYWTLDAQLHVHGSRKKLTAHYYGDKDGVMHDAEPGFDRSNYDPRVRPWYQQAMQANGLIITKPYIGASSKQMQVTIAKPAANGVVGGDMLAKGIMDSISQTQLPAEGYALLLHRDGSVISYRDTNKILKPATEIDPQLTPALIEQLKQASSLTDVTLEQRDKLLWAVPVPEASV